MAVYNLSFSLSDAIRDGAGVYEINYAAKSYQVLISPDETAAFVEHVVEENHYAAAVTALAVVNHLMNHFAAVAGISVAVNANYEYVRVDADENSRQVILLGQATEHASASDVPRSVADKDLRGAAFFRRGCLSLDPYDSFRNYYLAVDAVGKNILRGHCKDRDVLPRTIRNVVGDAEVQDLIRGLRQIAPDAMATAVGLCETIYERYRCALMHSGNNSDFTPFDAADEMKVREALGLMKRISKLYVQSEFERSK